MHLLRIIIIDLIVVRRSWDSAEGIATGYRLGNRGVGV
jgi:hypothetical protein